MKKTLLSFSLATLTLTAVNTANAELYYGLGYTQITDGGEVEDYVNDLAKLTAILTQSADVYKSHSVDYDSGQGLTGFIGFPIKNNFAIEARYTFMQDAIDAKVRLDIDSGYEVAEINSDAHKFGIHGVYRHSLNSFLYAKGGVGVTHTVYDPKNSYSIYNNSDNTMLTTNEKVFRIKENNTSIEATLGIGVRLTSCCNIELEYNTSQHNESALASVVWRY